MPIDEYVAHNLLAWMKDPIQEAVRLCMGHRANLGWSQAGANSQSG